MSDWHQRIREYGPGDIAWPFEGNGPVAYVGKATPWTDYLRSQAVDPFPCYAHDVDTLIGGIKAVESVVNLPRDYQPTFFNLPWEMPSRVNAYTDRSLYYSWKPQEGEAEGEKPWVPWVVLAGKRTPIHPAMTRYLVAHEYGHVIDWYLQRFLKPDHDPGSSDGSALDAEYAELRGLEKPRPYYTYGGNRWHDNIGEIIANDFRILVCGIEAEYWPHPGIVRPEYVEGLREWWTKACAKAGIA